MGAFSRSWAEGLSLLSDLIVDGKSFLPIEPFAVDRFAHSPAELELGKVPTTAESWKGA